MTSPDTAPDGGLKAWLAVAGGWCCLFVSFGWVTCIGVFQAHYQDHQLSGYSPSSIGWILSIETYFLFIAAPVVGKCFDSYGPRPLLVVGVFFHIFGLTMLSLCQEYYQIFLAQSFCSAIGAGAIFWASNNAVGTWFKLRRGLALGIVSSGSSVGGIFGTAAIPVLISRLGFGWAVRIVAFVYLALLSIALVTVKSRLEHKPSGFRPLDFIRPLKDWYVLSLGIAGFLFFLGVFLPYNFLVVEAIGSGMSRTLANNLLVILSATSVLGRIVPGWAGDRFGRFNVTIVFTFLTSLITLTIWIPASNNATRIAFAALYGFSSGTFVSMVPTLIAQICPDLSKLGVYMGAIYIVISPSIIITQPIGGALAQASDKNMIWMKIFCGVTMLTGSIMFVFARSAYLARPAESDKVVVTELKDLPALKDFRTRSYLVLDDD